MDVVIVESPAKAKTINKYLGGGYQVLASYGHVRDLPSKDGSVAPDEDFAMQWAVDGKSAKLLREIASAVKGADRLILATDPDREGEAISWHVLQVLEQKRALKDVRVERVVFNAVTKDAVLEAMRHPREIDGPLVNAYLARRALDYLVGFTLSPVLWRKLPGARSAGRVQSVALRLVCDREAEIERFRSQEYWSVIADMHTLRGEPFQARVVSADGEKLDKLAIADGATAQDFKRRIEGSQLTVQSVQSKPTARNPYPPFTTSTLQQEASRKLGFSARQTMQVAQRLYEGIDVDGETRGLITYMRTDGVQMAPEALAACRSAISGRYGEAYLSPKPRVYKTKAKNAQEAHEAIRPTDLDMDPDRAARYLKDEERKLYRLIWQRTVASQMASARFESTSIEIDASAADGSVVGLRANGSVQIFDGYLKLYQEGRDDAPDSDEDRRLPKVDSGEALTAAAVSANQHFTEPPPRYTEATLIKRMEELGIGRPSTYTATLSVLRDRDYVRLDKKRLVPEDKGRLVIAFLESFFARYVEYDFTAGLEEQLDKISAGDLDWKDVLRDFWRAFTAAVDDIKDLRVSEVLDALNDLLEPHVFPQGEPGTDPRKCPNCADGRLSLKTGRYGAFIGCSNYPECNYTRQFSDAGERQEVTQGNGRSIGTDPESGLEISLRSGRFGPYLQLGDKGDDGKPKRASVPKGFDPDAIDLDQALALLALPRDVGTHPETGKAIVAGFGRYGPFVEHDGNYANLPDAQEVFTIGLNRAVALLAERAASGGRARPSVLRDLGEHPELGGPIQLMSGRYGPYVRHGKINATLPKGSNPEALTAEEAIALIAAKAAGGKGGRKGGRRKRAD